MSSESTGFVHLHVHTHYSLLDGANRISDLIASTKQMGMPALAITDHGNMFGSVEFYLAAKKAGVKPILGMEAYIAPGDRRSREARGMGEASFHLLLLAETLEGYRNLMKLSSIAFREGFYYRPRIDREVLAAHAAGLICTSTCLGAEIPQALVKHDRAAAEQIADWYLALFGPERFFIELQDHGMPEQRLINPELIDIAQRRGIGLVATNDVHYLTHDDVEAHDVLCCISTGALVATEDRFKFPTDQFYLKTPADMAELFRDRPEAIDNSLRIAERCNVELPLGKRHTPVYRPPEAQSAEDYLRQLVYEGARERYGAESHVAQPPPAASFVAQPPSAVSLVAQPPPAVSLVAQPPPAVSFVAQPPPAVSSATQPQSTFEARAALDMGERGCDTNDPAGGGRATHTAGGGRATRLGPAGGGRATHTAGGGRATRLGPAEGGRATHTAGGGCATHMAGGGCGTSGNTSLPDDIRERIDYELGVIASKGFSSYFLIVWDFVQYARSRGIPCGARGSGCSAVVAHCLGISLPDPIHYGLYFERFMDPDRDEMPDIDIDICQDGREEVIRYVREKYGHVAQIITFGTLKARAAIRDVCRVLGVPLAEADRVAKLVPEALKMTIDKALESEPELRKLCAEQPQIRKVVDIARRIEGLARHAGVHAAGVVIADQPLENFVPVYRQAESKARAARSANGEPGGNGGAGSDITQFDGLTVEKVGLLKMDFLGLRTLTVLERARQLVGPVADPHPADEHGLIDLERLDLTDAGVYELFERGETQGIFQFESGGMRDVLMKMRPNRIEDLIAANALYRPGPMVNIDAYIARKHGQAWKTPHAIMTDVLAETYGIIVYQEQVARLVNRLGGIERKRAFRLAKAISKKNTAMIEAERGPFVEGAVVSGVAQATAEEIFNQILPFGEYAFNKAHSTGYALIAYQTAYMKRHFPHEYMAALLTFESRSQKIDQWYEYIDEAKRIGIDVRPPDVNDSDADFTVVRAASEAFLRFGLAAIKGVGDKAVAAVAAARKKGGRFRDLYDFCERVDLQAVNRSTIEALIKAGAFDTTGAMRKGLSLVLDAAMQAGSSAQADLRAGQLSMFGDAGAAADAPPPSIPAAEWSESEMLAHEKAVLGFYVTSHPLTRHAGTLRTFATADCADLSRIDQDTEVVLGGMISRVRTVITKNGRNAGSKLAVAMFEDLSGGIEAVVFAEELAKFRALVAPEKLVFLRGKVDRKREEPSLRVSDVIPLEDAAVRLATAVVLRLSAVEPESRELTALRDVLQAHRGACPVFLELPLPTGLTATVRCSAALSVTPGGAFVTAAEAIVGARRVTLLGATRRAVTARIAEPDRAMAPVAELEEAEAVMAG